MLFSSITFLYYFFPLVLLIYFAVPFSFKNHVLLLASLVFYAWGEPINVVYMLLSIAVHYLAGLLIERYQGRPLAKLYMILATVFSQLLLGYFKYTDFLLANLNFVFGSHLPLQKIALPIGVSFYTFQIMSYTFDVYRKETPAQKNILTLACYLTLFPQLIAGPIVRYVDVAAELEHREHSLERTRLGLRRFLVGLGKKVLLANTLGELGQIFLRSENPSVLFYWLYALAFSLQIYFDFSGYSDMAIGMGKVLGFNFLENFNYPYIAKSITEFWRRWHMSLSTWFRDYLYIPLGGNCVSKGRWVFNILLVWMLTGLWHGASWNFIFWGLLFAVLLILEKFGLQKRLNTLPKGFSHIYVLVLVVLSFVLFDAPNLTVALDRVKAMFGGTSAPLTDTLSLYYLRSYGVVFLVAFVGSTPWPKTLAAKFEHGSRTAKIFPVVEPLLTVGLLLLVTAYLVDSSYNPFLYFRF